MFLETELNSELQIRNQWQPPAKPEPVSFGLAGIPVENRDVYLAGKNAFYSGTEEDCPHPSSDGMNVNRYFWFRGFLDARALTVIPGLE